GRRAFEGDNAASVISAIMTAEPAPVHDFHPQSSEALEKILQRCLAKDPDERWQNAADIRHALDLVETSTAPPSAPAAKTRLAWPWLAAAVIFGGLIAAAGLRFASPKPPVLPVFRPLTYSGRAYVPALSPDGKQVAFLWSGYKDQEF